LYDVHFLIANSLTLRPICSFRPFHFNTIGIYKESSPLFVVLELTLFCEGFPLNMADGIVSHSYTRARVRSGTDAGQWGSKSAWQFIPKVFIGDQVWTLCRSVKFFHTTLAFNNMDLKETSTNCCVKFGSPEWFAPMSQPKRVHLKDLAHVLYTLFVVAKKHKCILMHW